MSTLTTTKEMSQTEKSYYLWLSKQSLPVEAAFETVKGALAGAVVGTSVAVLFQKACPEVWLLTRNVAAMTGVFDGVSCVMKRIRGKDDVQSCMVAGFGSGAMYSLVYAKSSLHPVTSGLFFALAMGAFCKVGEKFDFSKQLEEDLVYARTRHMLTGLGLQQYEKNFKKGLLTDSVLPLLDDSALKEVEIPAGPRLLILNKIKRNPEMRN